jgi:hypothetical protein
MVVTQKKKVEAKFKFSKDWIDLNEKKQEVIVDLIINFHNKTFSITPNNQVAGKFTFCQGGANSVIMWNCVLETIKEATYFAHKELGF